jgi:hypothetical protein
MCPADASSATEHNQDLLNLLQELRPGASPREQQKIDDILAGVRSCRPLDGHRFLIFL